MPPPLPEAASSSRWLFLCSLLVMGILVDGLEDSSPTMKVSISVQDGTAQHGEITRKASAEYAQMHPPTGGLLPEASHIFNSCSF